jgi:limonene-1,2-epoxide hydrolase
VIALFIRPGAPGTESIDFHLVNIAADGPVVTSERVDAFKLPYGSFDLPVMGAVEVTDGRISGWRDHFEMERFTSRMG